MLLTGGGGAAAAGAGGGANRSSKDENAQERVDIANAALQYSVSMVILPLHWLLLS